jgi:uncharacterized OB-fold protein
VSEESDAPATRAIRQLPALDGDNRAFWTGGEQGQLLIVRCGDCGTYNHPPRPRCPKCGGAHVKPEPVSGRGRVASYTINHQAWIPRLKTPYVIAAIELDEQPGLHVFTNIVGCEAEDVSTGMRVEVEVENIEDVWFPLFRPVGGA